MLISSFRVHGAVSSWHKADIEQTDGQRQLTRETPGSRFGLFLSPCDQLVPQEPTARQTQTLQASGFAQHSLTALGRGGGQRLLRFADDEPSRGRRLTTRSEKRRSSQPASKWFASGFRTQLSRPSPRCDPWNMVHSWQAEIGRKPRRNCHRKLCRIARLTDLELGRIEYDAVGGAGQLYRLHGRHREIPSFLRLGRANPD
jgi:hypothetical protein